MLNLALSRAEAVELQSVLQEKLVDVRREIAHTDARRFREKLYDAADTVERLLEQVSRLLSAQVSGASDGESLPPDIDQFLREHDVSYAVIHHAAAYTALREAAAAHISGREWAKAVVCVADEKPALAVVSADHAIDLQRLRDLMGAGRMRLATEAEIATLYTGCELGAMPPFGPLYGQRVFVDERVTSNHDIAFCGGSHRDAIRMRYRDFARLVQPTVGGFARMH